MDFDNKIELLRTIQKVDVPPFLFSRIEAGLQNEVYQASKQWKLAFVVCSIIILFINVFMFTNVSKVDSNNNASQVVSSMQLETSNQLYHD